jgi:hypothetical protein
MGVTCSGAFRPPPLAPALRHIGRSDATTTAGWQKTTRAFFWLVLRPAVNRCKHPRCMQACIDQYLGPPTHSCPPAPIHTHTHHASTAAGSLRGRTPWWRQGLGRRRATSLRNRARERVRWGFHIHICGYVCVHTHTIHIVLNLVFL